MAAKDLLGYRQTVFTRGFSGKEWLMHHSIQEDNYMFLAMDENWTTILPQEAKKLGNGYLVVNFPNSITGYVSIFRLTPLLNFQIINVNDTNIVNFYHKFNPPDFIVQTWDSDGYLVLPKTIQKDTQICTVEFDHNFTGTICCVFITNEVRYFTDEIAWQYIHRIQISRGCILLQADDKNNQVILPLEEKRFDSDIKTSFDNFIELDWSLNQSGKLLNIIHGYNI